MTKSMVEVTTETIRKLKKEGLSAPQVWRHVSKLCLHPDDPFHVHQTIFEECYRDWVVEDSGPSYVWIPSQHSHQTTNLSKFMRVFGADEVWNLQKSGDATTDYPLLQQVSVNNPEAFWTSLFHFLEIEFYKRPHRIYVSAGHPDEVHWLPGCLMNIADLCLSRGDPDAAAIVWAHEDCPHKLQTQSYGVLRANSMRIGQAVRTKFHPGDAIAIYMPMTATSVALYLGIILAGCVVVSIPESFAPSAIEKRLRLSKAKAIFTQDYLVRSGKHIELYKKVVEANFTTTIVLGQSGKDPEVDLRPCDISWNLFLAGEQDNESFSAHPGNSDDLVNILFSSGTTGDPKAIPWTHTTPLRCAVDGWAHQDIHEGGVVCWPSSLGWMMGPWLIFSSLFNRAAIAVYEGTPTTRGFCRFVSCARVSVLGVVPSIVRAWRKTGARQGIDWGSIHCFSSTGEASSPEDYHWLSAQAGYKPVVEYCGGTEIGGAYLTGCLLQPQAPSTFSTPTLGADLVLISEDGLQSPHPSHVVFQGELAIAPPMLGTSQKLLNNDHHKIYFKGMPVRQGSSIPLRRHGDEMERLPGGYYRALGRSDDTMNLGGIKVSSVELERAIKAKVKVIEDVAALGISPSGGGPEKLVIAVVMKNNKEHPDVARLKHMCQQAVTTMLNPLYKVSDVTVLHSLPRTESNKVMRRTLRAKLMRPKL